MILHLLGEIDFLGLDAVLAVLAQLHQPAARVVGRGGEHLAVVVDRRGAVDPDAVGGPVVPPEELAVGRRDPDERLRGELHVLALPVEVDGDGRGVARPGRAKPAGTAGPAGRLPPPRRHLALPDRLAGHLVEGHQGRVRAAGGADDLVAVDERRLAVTPHRRDAAEVLRQADLPEDLAVLDLKARQVAAHAQDVEPFAVDRRRAARTFLGLGHALLERRPEARHPQLLAVRLDKRPDDLVVAAVAHAEDSAAGDGRALSPPPSPLTFQASGGPSLGHSLRRPFSLETAFRSGPCHCGQSKVSFDRRRRWDRRTEPAQGTRHSVSSTDSLCRVGSTSLSPDLSSPPV